MQERVNLTIDFIPRGICRDDESMIALQRCVRPSFTCEVFLKVSVSHSRIHDADAVDPGLDEDDFS